MQEDIKIEIKPEITFITEEEQVYEDATPWMTEQTSKIANPIVRLHNEIIDFVRFVEPSEEEHLTRTHLFNAIETAIKERMPEVSITNPLFQNKMYMKNTELEMFTILNTDEPNWQISCIECVRSFAESLNLKIYNLSLEVNEQDCRVICLHEESKIEVWIRFVPSSWTTFINEIYPCVETCSEIRYIYFILDCMIRQRSFQTNIKSLMTYGLCSFFIFERRKQRVRTLSENIMKLLEFYSIGFIHEKERKVTYKPGNNYVFHLNNEKVFKFEIAESVDISSRKIRDLFKVFNNRYRVLGNYYYVPGSSVLAHLLNPCLGKFFY